MSEALMSGVAMHSKGAAANSRAGATPDTADSQQTADFSLLFGDAMLQDPQGVGLSQAIDPAQLQQWLNLHGEPAPGSQSSSLAAVDPARGKSLPPGLPQLAFSALLAVDNGDQAAAMTLQGDAGAVRASQPVVSQDLSQAMREALARQMLQRQDSAAALSATQLSQSNPGLNPEHFKLELNNLTQGLTDQLAREVSPDVAHNSKALPAASSNANTSTSGLNSLNALSAQLGSGQRPEGAAGNGVPVPPQHPQWGQQVGERVQWMIGQNLQRADIRLNPPELGSLEVRIQLNGDQQTNISFSSPNAQVREALEAALPRLREMMNDSGLDLGNVDVSQHSFADAQTEQSGQEGERQRGGHGAEGDSSVTEGPEAESGLPIKHAAGLVDFYA